MTAPTFWNRIAPRYAARPISDPDTYEEKLRRTRAHLRPDMAVLELGCGTGGTALRHAPHVARYRATDIAPAMIAIARERAGETAPTGLDFEVATVEEAIGARNSVDAVLALNLLHLLPDWTGAVGRIHAGLRPGGLFVSSTACLADTHAWFRWIGPIGRALGLFPLVRVFSSRDLVGTIERAGFTVLDNWQPDPKAARFIIVRKE